MTNLLKESLSNLPSDEDEELFSSEFLSLVEADVLVDTDDNCNFLFDLYDEFRHEVVDVYSTYPELKLGNTSTGMVKIVFTDRSCVDMVFEDGYIYLFNSILL